MIMRIQRLALVAFCGMAGLSFAQQSSLVRPAYMFPAAPSGSGPASVQVGDTPIYFTPYLGVAAGHDDNLFLTNTNQTGSNLYVVSPGLRIEARDANSVLQASYQGQYGRYTSSRDDDYIDHTFRGQGDWAFDSRNFLRLGIDYMRGHDPRGSTDRPNSSSPDRYRQTTPYATYAYGAPGAQGRVEAYASQATKRYLNNFDVTQGSDRDVKEYGGIFYWRAMPKTYVLFEARETKFDYKLDGSPFNSKEHRYYGGVSWEPTVATVGTIKVGRIEKTFESDVPKFKDTSWEAVVSWSPRTYSKFDFYTTRTPQESTGLGDFILSDIYGVSWTHSWSSVLSTSVDARYSKDRYQGFDRTDEVKSLGVKVGYRFRRWLTLGAEYTYTQRDSNQTNFEYDRNLYLLTATASM